VTHKQYKIRFCDSFSKVSFPSYIRGFQPAFWEPLLYLDPWSHATFLTRLTWPQEPTLLVHCLYYMPPLNHKRTTSSLAPQISCVAKKLAIKRLKAPHYLQCNEKISNFHHQRHQIMFYIFGTYNLYKYVCVFISFAQSNKRIVAQSLYVQNFVPKFFSYLLTILPTFKALA